MYFWGKVLVLAKKGGIFRGKKSVFSAKKGGILHPNIRGKGVFLKSINVDGVSRVVECRDRVHNTLLSQ